MSLSETDRSITKLSSGVAGFVVFSIALFLTGLANIPGAELRNFGVSAEEVTVLRSVSAAAVFILLFVVSMAWSDLKAPSKQEWYAVLCFALFGVVLTNGGTTYSVSIAPSYVAVPIIFGVTVATSLALSLWWDHTSRGAVDVVFAALLITMVTMLTLVDNKAETGISWIAIVAPVVTGISQGILYRLLATDMRSIPFFGLGFSIGAVPMAMVAVATGVVDPQNYAPILTSAKGLLNLSVLVVLMTVIPYLAARSVAKSLTVFAKSIAGSSEPVGGVTSDLWVAQETGAILSAMKLTIVSAIVVSVVLYHLFARKRPAQEPQP